MTLLQSLFAEAAQLDAPLGHTTSFGYDDLSRLTSVTDALLHWPQFDPIQEAVCNDEFATSIISGEGTEGAAEAYAALLALLIGKKAASVACLTVGVPKDVYNYLSCMANAAKVPGPLPPSSIVPAPPNRPTVMRAP